MNPFGHIDLRVRDLEAATMFYDALLPALGFSERYHGGEWNVWATTGPSPDAAYFAVTEDPAHKANANRIALQVTYYDREVRRENRGLDLLYVLTLALLVSVFGLAALRVA